jgi:hypothetical protein
MVLVDLMPGVARCVALLNQKELRAGVDLFQRLPILPPAMRLHRKFGSKWRFRSDSWISRRAIPRRDVAMSCAYPDMQAFVSFQPLVVTKNEETRSTVE